MKEAIKKWNFFWKDSTLLEKVIGVERNILEEMILKLETRHIKDIIGVRRSGKTVLMYQIINKLLKKGIKTKRILYLNFDDPEFFDIKETIKNALQINPDIKYVFLDEIQNIDAWERIIRVYYDRNKFEQIFVSGSSASLISRDVGKTLTGRHMTTSMLPFSFKEFLKYHKVNHLISDQEKIIHCLEIYLNQGGFPEILDKSEFIAKTILVDLYNDILSRDIVSRFDAEIEIVQKIGYYLMTNLCSIFSYNSIARALNLHYNTVKKYIPYFEEVFLVFCTPFFSWKVKSHFKKNKKCYLVDNGLRNAVSFKFSKDLGKLAENVVLVELKRRKNDVYFWKGKKEVDLVVREENKLTAINVSYTDKIPKREHEGLLEFKKEYKNANLILITKEIEKEENNINYIPLWKWLTN